MKKTTIARSLLPVFSYLLKWMALTIPVALATGSLVALFLWLLDRALDLRFHQPWLLFLLPLAGIMIHFLYKAAGKNAEAGNNLVMDEIHEPGGGVPLRMAPLVLVTTLITHLFGGSAGREGTAVQMGGSLAQFFARSFRLGKEDISILLMTGMAAGFGAVFGTPVTGAIFAMEVLSIGSIRHRALMPCLMAAILGHLTCSAWGIHHTDYFISSGSSIPTLPFLEVDLLLLLQVTVAGILFGWAALLFSLTTDTVKKYSQRFIPVQWLIPVAGAVVIILLTYILGTTDYLGLGVSSRRPEAVTILSSFTPGGAGALSWWWKLLFTAITLGTGFKGGEVTPLFFIGAALGNTLSAFSGAPADLMAGLGFIAVFAGATNTPLACTLMGVELFGGEHILYYAIACFTAYYFSGRKGIYASQRINAKR